MVLEDGTWRLVRRRQNLGTFIHRTVNMPGRLSQAVLLVVCPHRSSAERLETRVPARAGCFRQRSVRAKRKATVTARPGARPAAVMFPVRRYSIEAAVLRGRSSTISAVATDPNGDTPLTPTVRDTSSHHVPPTYVVVGVTTETL